MRRIILFFASGAYTGYIPVASGTWGTLLAFPLFWIFEPWRHLSTGLYLVWFVACVAAACWVAGRAEAILQEHDSHAIVIDEIASMDERESGELRQRHGWEVVGPSPL